MHIASDTAERRDREYVRDHRFDLGLGHLRISKDEVEKLAFSSHFLVLSRLLCSEEGEAVGESRERYLREEMQQEPCREAFLYQRFR